MGIKLEINEKEFGWVDMISSLINEKLVLTSRKCGASHCLTSLLFNSLKCFALVFVTLFDCYLFWQTLQYKLSDESQSNSAPASETLHFGWTSHVPNTHSSGLS